MKTPGHSDVVMSATLQGSNKMTSGSQIYYVFVCVGGTARLYGGTNSARACNTAKSLLLEI